MSGLIDMWSNEVAKLRNKTGQDQTGSIAAEPIFSNATNYNEMVRGNHESLSLFQRYGLASNLVKLNKLLNYSEASVSMIVDCVSP